MQRFGRTAQTKMKDGWGGSFVLAAILCLALAYWAGDYISKRFGGTETAGPSPAGVTGVSPKTGGTTGAAMSEPHQFQVYFVQAGAFRSDAKAKDLMHTLADHSYQAMVTARDSTGMSHVYAGVYTSQENADNVKAKLTADGITTGAYTRPVTVDHNPEAVPAISSTTKGTEVKSALDALNTYLYEAAVLMENRAAGVTADTTSIASLGKKLSEIAINMTTDKDPNVKKFADVAALAAVNARALEGAASASVSSDQYQSAMSGYLSLLEQYRSLQPTK
ncbi:MAG TPA: SPOR domain-containing protein [Symbiobacteriaceae bacterium]|jgi:hypothetical protein